MKKLSPEVNSFKDEYIELCLKHNMCVKSVIVPFAKFGDLIYLEDADYLEDGEEEKK